MAFLRHSSPQPLLDQAKYPSVGDPVLNELDQVLVNNCSEKVTNVGVKHPVHLFPHESNPQRIQRMMRAAPWSEPIREPLEVLFINLVQDCHHPLLDDFVLKGGDAQGPLSSICFGNVGSLGRLRSIRSPVYSAV